MAALRDAIKRVAAGEDARAAVAAAAGGSWAEFERGWRGFMAAQHYKTFPAIDIPTTHIRKPSAIASGRKPTEEDALSNTLKAGAPFRHLRLGNMLLRRDRPRAAVASTRRGPRRSRPARARGDPSAAWVFPVKLGRTYLALGEPDRALKALAPVQAMLPGSAVAEPDRGRGADGEGGARGAHGPAAGGAGHQPVRSPGSLRAGGCLRQAAHAVRRDQPPGSARASNRLRRRPSEGEWARVRAAKVTRHRGWSTGGRQIGDLVHGDPPTREVSDESDPEKLIIVVALWSLGSGARRRGTSPGDAPPSHPPPPRPRPPLAAQLW